MSVVLNLLDCGQSLWLDYIDRNLVSNGGLKQLVGSGIQGVTSNPTIFHKAISGSKDYDDTIRDLIQGDHEIDEATLYHWLTIEDVQMAADALRSVYDSSHGVDGYVSLEVSPHLAYNTSATVESARRLWSAVSRPNLMIKVPSTKQGLPAISHLIGEGINVNATLLFSSSRFEEVAQAYIRGLAVHPNPRAVASVASFFISRVDTKVDQILEKIGTPQALKLKGKIAIANAKVAYRKFQEIIKTEAFLEQKQRGARTQRPLWASTGTKNPAFSDVLYVDSLIGPDTVNTVPLNTLDAFQHHGEVRKTLTADLDVAYRHLEQLQALGVNLDEITQQLEDEGVAAFADSYDQLLTTLRDKRSQVAKDYALS